MLSLLISFETVKLIMNWRYFKLIPQSSLKSSHIPRTLCCNIISTALPRWIVSGTPWKWDSECCPSIKYTHREGDQNKNVPRRETLLFVSGKLDYGITGPISATHLLLQLRRIGVSFRRTSGYELNVAEIVLASNGGRSHAGPGGIQRIISPQYQQQSSDQCWNITGGFQTKRKQWKPHSKCAKVLLHNVCYHNLHYSINGDLGGLLIKMSLPRRQNHAVTSLNLN